MKRKLSRGSTPPSYERISPMIEALSEYGKPVNEPGKKSGIQIIFTAEISAQDNDSSHKTGKHLITIPVKRQKKEFNEWLGRTLPTEPAKGKRVKGGGGRKAIDFLADVL